MIDKMSVLKEEEKHSACRPFPRYHSIPLVHAFSLSLHLHTILKDIDHGSLANSHH